MGYTHYPNYRPQSAEWERIWPTLLNDAREIIQFAHDQGYPVAGGMGEGEPEIGPDRICLNGPGDQGCETFHLAGPGAAAQEELKGQRDGREYVFDFCKTNRQPYDAVVCAIMLRAAQLSPRNFIFGSDGDWNIEWEEGAHEHLGARQITRAVFGTDAMPEPAREYFLTGVDAGELFARLDRTQVIEQAPDVTTRPFSDMMFDSDGGLGL